MKKSGIILIALIYVASIVVVGFLGLKAKSYNDVIYVDRLEVMSEYTVNKEGDKIVVFRPTGEERTVQLLARVLPEDASDQKVIYSLDPDCKIATINEDGLLSFTEEITRPSSVKVYLYSNQNPTISDEIIVYFIP